MLTAARLPGDGWNRKVVAFFPTEPLLHRMSALSPEYLRCACHCTTSSCSPRSIHRATFTAGSRCVTGKLVVDAVLDAHPTARGLAAQARRPDRLPRARWQSRRRVHLDGVRDVATLPDEVTGPRPPASTTVALRHDATCSTRSLGTAAEMLGDTPGSMSRSARSRLYRGGAAALRPRATCRRSSTCARAAGGRDNRQRRARPRPWLQALPAADEGFAGLVVTLRQGRLGDRERRIGDRAAGSCSACSRQTANAPSGVAWAGGAPRLDRRARPGHERRWPRRRQPAACNTRPSSTCSTGVRSVRYPPSSAYGSAGLPTPRPRGRCRWHRTPGHPATRQRRRRSIEDDRPAGAGENQPARLERRLGVRQPGAGRESAPALIDGLGLRGYRIGSGRGVDQARQLHPGRSGRRAADVAAPSGDVRRRVADATVPSCAASEVRLVGFGAGGDEAPEPGRARAHERAPDERAGHRSPTRTVEGCRPRCSATTSPTPCWTSCSSPSPTATPRGREPATLPVLGTAPPGGESSRTQTPPGPQPPRPGCHGVEPDDGDRQRRRRR